VKPLDEIRKVLSYWILLIAVFFCTVCFSYEVINFQFFGKRIQGVVLKREVKASNSSGSRTMLYFSYDNKVRYMTAVGDLTRLMEGDSFDLVRINKPKYLPLVSEVCHVDLVYVKTIFALGSLLVLSVLCFGLKVVHSKESK